MCKVRILDPNYFRGGISIPEDISIRRDREDGQIVLVRDSQGILPLHLLDQIVDDLVAYREEVRSNADRFHRITYGRITKEQAAIQALQYQEEVRERQTTTVKNRPGYVYVIRNDGYYKIGRAKDLDRRFLELSSATPNTLDVVHAVKVSDYCRAEIFLHNRFSTFRMHREWFNLNDEHVDYLTSLKDDTFYTEASV
jgi:hypothetical protein